MIEMWSKSIEILNPYEATMEWIKKWIRRKIRMSEQEIYKSAIEKYGANHQETKAIEEMSELIKEICKNKDGEDNVEQIAEEIADVQIMLEQMKILFDCETAVCFWQDEKLQRLQKRLENEK